MNEAQNAVFWKYGELGKIFDLCMLALVILIVASIYRHSRQLITSIKHYMNHDWTEDGAILWMNEVVANDMESILISENDREDELEI